MNAFLSTASLEKKTTQSVYYSYIVILHFNTISKKVISPLVTFHADKKYIKQVEFDPLSHVTSDLVLVKLHSNKMTPNINHLFCF